MSLGFYVVYIWSVWGFSSVRNSNACYIDCVTRLFFCFLFLLCLCSLSSVSLSPGSVMHGYTVQSVTEVPDFNLIAVQLTHNNTDARHLHIARRDSNNTFGCVSLAYI